MLRASHLAVQCTKTSIDKSILGRVSDGDLDWVLLLEIHEVCSDLGREVV